ncbi:MAG: Alpha/beta hydrolase family protein [Actinomycetota bacterium]|nr:Alpha/beta hydrolase family protein [Actinomycetota bacterium]
MSRWVTRGVALAAIAVVVWVLITAWPVVVHGHPLYAALLVLTVVGAGVAFVRSLQQRPARTGWRRVLWAVGVVAAVGWIAVMAWLKPFTAEEPALTAMKSDAQVTVTETPTAIVLAPASGEPATGLLFQPGAKVDARAYAAVLRPAAEAGDLVVIPKQPLGVAFLASGALSTARTAHPEITEWVVGGHSLGGTVASSTALADAGQNEAAPVAGLLLYASYPAGDARAIAADVMSISGTEDGLATPADIEASRANLPASSDFVVIDGAGHAYFGDYGPQPGDGTPTIDHTDARAQISAATVELLDRVRVKAAGV